MSKKLNSDAFLKQLWVEPELAIEKLNLVYASENELKIKRKRKQKSFVYEFKGKPIKDEIELNRINKLVIPPAWKKVSISYLENTHLQATGRDAKARKQYRYHPIWNKIRNQTKFYRMRFFGELLPLIREQIDKDLNQKGWPKTKTLALIVKLMEETHIRIGNTQYAKRNKTYGLSTLRTRHVNVSRDKIKFEFTGKKGKEHCISLRNKKLIYLVNKCQELPGWELFKYYDADGEKHTIDSSMVNDYIFSLCEQHFTAKDFRTWAASVVFLDTLYDLGLTKNEKQKDKNILTSFDAAAKALGNTRNVCKKYYVHPILVKSYQDDTISEAFKIIDSNKNKHLNLSNTEEALLFLLDKFKPDLKV
ncbi:DNA topoisomerase IB [Lacinutrix sp. MedPE-SW]|uniref:DNA topoisomerase IB n=1 Tax=Lacinutrix sp. MedPE-SW TaxID=1860087 RepID=UPI00091B4327|nr:DNA topoisomerase IB [Lacinutrix sp. MedPE-SW]OIQ23014.1 MAG: DNA topoisomerase I [Lacinutrix sp. MedPE-SW]